MKEETAAALINANAAAATIKLQAMITENKVRESKGESLAYSESDFLSLIQKYGIHFNAIMELLERADG